jgi:succinate dehydrogenase / fumarate reductase cytochrome b subunit
MSPHMTIWRWHVTMFTSIAHRATGVALYGGALIAAAWAVSLASGPEAYATYMGLMGSWLGKLVMFGLSVCGFYHLGNGVRHLVWDFGHGLDVKSATTSSMTVIAFTITATLVAWGIAFWTGALA